MIQENRISTLLSLILRHKPETIGIVLDNNGWTDVAILIEQFNQHYFYIDKEILEYVVETNSKKRFAFNEDHSKIRASQGHSVHIDVAYPPQKPLPVLYHGTGEKSVDSIMATGLQKRQRCHVHLSADIETAIIVGRRHGKPCIFQIDAEAMYNDMYDFFLSDNGIWLTDIVPVQYLKKYANSHSGRLT